MSGVLRIALCQANLVVGDLAGNVAVLQARIHEAPGAARRRRPLPRAFHHRLPAGGSPAQAELRAGRGGGTRYRGRERHRHRRLRRGSGRRRGGIRNGGTARRRGGARRARAAQQRGGAGRRSYRRAVPQAPFAQLRRLRRAPLLHAGRRGGRHRSRRPAPRRHDLRGHLGAGRSGGMGGPGRRRGGHPQSLGLAVSPGQGPGARGAVRRPLPRPPLLPGVLQRRRRAGRTGLRRPQPRHRTRRDDHRPRRAVRRGHAGRGPRSSRRTRASCVGSAVEWAGGRLSEPRKSHPAGGGPHLRRASPPPGGPRAHAARAAPDGGAAVSRRGDLPCAHPRDSGLHPEERLSRSRARAVGRDRFRARADHRGGCNRPGGGDRRLDAVAVHGRDEPGRRRDPGPPAGRQVPGAADRGPGGQVRRGRWPPPSRARSRTSPRRTCRRGSGATC